MGSALLHESAEENQMKQIELSIIIPTYNRAALLQSNIANILKSIYAFELLIVDDASQDETRQVIESFGDPRITYLKHDSNFGQSKSLNDGIDSARNSKIMVCEDDAFILNPDRFFRILLSELQQEMIVGTHLLVNGKENKSDYMGKIARFFAEPLSKEVYLCNGNKRRIVNYCNACFAFNRDSIKVRFEECDYVRNNYRFESDFQLRARREGAHIVYDPKLKIDHRHHITGGNRVGSRNRFLFLSTLNHMIFLGKFYSTWNIYFYLFLRFLAHPKGWRILGEAFQTYLRIAPTFSNKTS